VGRFRESLGQPGLSAVAEVKRRSPSAGDLRPGADPAALAASYERTGAAAVSILVDARFGGTWDDLRAARATTAIPLLAKGFFSTEEHLRTARESGADAVLLLLLDLDDAAVRRCCRLRDMLGLDALVGTRCRELARAVAPDASVIGINARDLATYSIDRREQLKLVARAPETEWSWRRAASSRGRTGHTRSSQAPPRSSWDPHSCGLPTPQGSSSSSCRARS
jgi:indole-3-glycerol phosphate synthase